MVNLDIDSAVESTASNSAYSDKTKNSDFYDGTPINLDSNVNEENKWRTDFATWHGYYDEIPIFSAIIDALACWAVGKGFKGKDAEKLRKIKGWGKDDANSIFENMVRCFLICGDSHSEIIKDKAKRLTNLKPMNTGTINQIVNKRGILQRYEQENNPEPFKVEEVFHLCWNRLGDEIHGKPEAHRAEPIIKQIKQLQEDLGLRFHRVVKPIRLFEADTDNETSLTTIEGKLKTAYEKCDIIVVPKGTIGEAPGKNITPADDAIRYFDILLRNLVSACGVPEIILGWSSGTEASSKIVYLAFQQRIEKIQRFLEDQIKLQLGLEINFEFPASLEPAMTQPQGQGNFPPKVNSPASDNSKHSKLNTNNPAK